MIMLFLVLILFKIYFLMLKKRISKLLRQIAQKHTVLVLFAGVKSDNKLFLILIFNFNNLLFCVKNLTIQLFNALIKPL